MISTAVRSILTASAMALAVGAFAAEDKIDPRKKDTRPDAAFVTQAGQDGLAEVQLGKVAQQNASSAAVKEFAQRMVTDHSKAGDELAGIAKKVGITPPKEPSEKQQAELKKLSALKGEKFDAEYAQLMVRDHESAVALFQKQSKNGETAELKEFATKTLPTLEEHLKMARDLKKQVGQKKS